MILKCSPNFGRQWSSPMNHLMKNTVRDLTEALQDLSRPFSSHYGATMGIAALGPKVLSVARVFVLFCFILLFSCSFVYKGFSALQQIINESFQDFILWWTVRKYFSTAICCALSCTIFLPVAVIVSLYFFFFFFGNPISSIFFQFFCWNVHIHGCTSD